MVFLSDPGIPGVQSKGPHVTEWVSEWVIERGSWDFKTEDANSILTDNADRAIQSKDDELMAYFGTNANIGINLFW